MEIKIIEPNGVFYEGTGDFLEFTTVAGEMGVYENHIPTTSILESCVVKIHDKGMVKKAAVLGGFVEIQKHRITMLAEDANWPEKIDVQRAKEAKARAEKRIQEHSKDTDMVRAEAALRRALARIAATK